MASVTVTDRDGHLRATARRYPADPAISYSDRDWFRALKDADPGIPFVSQAYTGRQSGQPIFILAGRVTDSRTDFDGAIAVSVSRNYFEKFYKSIEREFDYNVTLVREDGQILAREPQTQKDVLPPEAPFYQYLQSAGNGTFTSQSKLDGVERIFAYRKVDNYPVHVGFGLGKDAALAPWRRNLLTYGIVAVLASIALLGASGLAVRQTYRERQARKRWQETAVALQAEAVARERVEEQLRQAQKMEAVGRLTGGVAHDFNNLLTIIIGSLDLLRRRMANQDDRVLRLVGNAIDGANRAATLTHRLLAFSRQSPLDPVQVDANRLVAGMSDLWRRTLGENIAIETVLAGDLWPTFADPNQLESALLNMAVNARDAMPDGGKLTIETANTHLDDAYAAARAEVKAGQYVMIAVCDTGSGMSSDVVAKVFEPFFTTKPVGKGTGLGLSQVYGFAQQSGGHVAVSSEVGQGTTIKLYLPRLRQRPAPPTVAPPQPIGMAPATDGETILIVEDEDMVRQFGVAALSEAGYRVLAAADGPSGLELLNKHPEIRLLFTDVVLAGPMNGRMLADAALMLRPGLPVMFTTGYTRNAIIHHGRLDEGVNFIGKPFTMDALSAKIRFLLDRKVHSASERSS